MIISVRVKPESTREAIENFGNNRYLTRVLAKEIEEVNAELIKMFSTYFGMPTHKIVIKSGWDTNDKVLELQ